jgi:hypothetical protein
MKYSCFGDLHIFDGWFMVFYITKAGIFHWFTISSINLHIRAVMVVIVWKLELSTIFQLYQGGQFY